MSVRGRWISALPILFLFAAPVSAAEPAKPDPAVIDPTTTNSLGVLSNAAQVMPLLTDAGSFLSAGQDPGAYVGDLQNLLNDGGNLLGVPSAGSYIPQMPLNAANPIAAPPDSGA